MQTRVEMFPPGPHASLILYHINKIQIQDKFTPTFRLDRFSITFP